MSFTIRAKIDGLAETLKTLDGLKTGLKNKVLRPAFTKATKPILKAAKGNLSKMGYAHGLLYKSLGTKVGVSRKGNVFAVVGPRTGFKEIKGLKGIQQVTALGKRYLAGGRNPSYYAHFVELGTKPHAVGKGSRLKRVGKRGKVYGGQQSGRMHPGTKPMPFLGPTLGTVQGEVLEIVAREVAAGLAKLGK